jgi:hypothetical protein
MAIHYIEMKNVRATAFHSADGIAETRKISGQNGGRYLDSGRGHDSRRF